MPRLRALPDKLRRLRRSFRESQARPDDCWALARLTPAEGRLYLRMDARDREHAVRVAQALLAACLEEDSPPSSELLAGAILHDCGKLVWPYRVWERVGAGLLPYRIAAWVPWMPAQVRAQHAEWGALLVRREGGRARVSELVAAHHHPAGDPEAAWIHRLDDLE
ncbi:phosphohydrolase [Deinococcus piscis]|uniref:Phosphohydrolase n=1 Tax=Deinococcus piscis TaxID=394230 RepID=A0ABQ3K512_9DEIO|nr:HD domain-containing protein [Deinococcus piscis]GHG02414.1 phosphohydrolase [Deinococcus piscis]